MDNLKVLVVGIGGVGGYFGGLLAKAYENALTVSIYFLARGSHLKEIQQNGLKVIKGENEFTAFPAKASANAHNFGPVDLVILCTKSYDLESSLKQIEPCLTKETYILPLLNGVNHYEKLSLLLPQNQVLLGCVYIISRLKKEGVIENIGNAQKLFFGLQNHHNAKLAYFESIFKKAGIEATLTENILKIVWEKFLFISTTATATAYYNTTFGGLVADKNKFKTVLSLIDEAEQLAKKENIDLPDDVKEKIIKQLKSMPENATSSMQTDFINNKPNIEIESLTGYVYFKSKGYQLNPTTYHQIYLALKKKSQNDL